MTSERLQKAREAVQAGYLLHTDVAQELFTMLDQVGSLLDTCREIAKQNKTLAVERRVLNKLAEQVSELDSSSG